MIGQGIEAIKNMGPNSYVIVLLVVFISERVISMVIKGVVTLRNGQGKEKKDETQRLPCVMNPGWNVHTQETHDAKLSGERVEGGMRSLLLESTKQTLEMKNQTTEIKKQTKGLEAIKRNGSKE